MSIPLAIVLDEWVQPDNGYGALNRSLVVATLQAREFIMSVQQARDALAGLALKNADIIVTCFFEE